MIIFEILEEVLPFGFLGFYNKFNFQQKLCVYFNLPTKKDKLLMRAVNQQKYI